MEKSDVKLSVQRLCELGERMRTPEFSFKDKDISHIDEVINAMQELELMCSRAHETLETETIKTSALRHKVVYYPVEINKEIQDAVNAARGLNEETSQKLNSQLQITIGEIDDLEQEIQRLQAENAKLNPQRDTISLEYEEVIAKLNTRLANKANKQIDLNDLRDDVRGCNEKIVELEEDILQLKEDLVKERAETREEKNRLNELTASTNKELKTQNDKNKEVKYKLSVLQDEVAVTKKKIKELKDSIRKVEKQIAELNSQENSLTDQIERELDMNIQLKQKGIDIKDETHRMTENFKARMIEFGIKLKEFEAAIEKESGKTEGLQDKRDILKEELAKAQKIADEESSKMRKLNDILQRAKGDVAVKAEDIGRMQMEMADMEERMVNLAETHESTVSLLTKQIEELKELLSRERGERMDIQSNKDALQKEIDDFRAANAKFMKDLNKRIADGKQEHASLTNQRSQLQAQIKADMKKSDELEKETIVARENLSKMRADLSSKLATMRSEKAAMEASIVEKTAELDIKTPQFKEFEEYFNKQIAKYDVLKKTLVALKNRKANLDDSINRTQRDIEKSKGPLASLQEDLNKKQSQAREQLSHHADERTEVEKEIYASGCKLKVLKEENARFDKAISDLDAKIKHLRDNWENALKSKSRVKQEVTKQRDTLHGSWLQDASMEEDFADRDNEVLAMLSLLLSETGDRQATVGTVTRGLQRELGGLTEFLENVGGRRQQIVKKSASPLIILWIQTVKRLILARRLGSPYF